MHTILTLLAYVGVVALVAVALYLVAGAVFGRGEELAPVSPGTTVTVLPAYDVTGADVQELRFQQTVRGYRMSEVDWALDRLAREIDTLRGRLADYESGADGTVARVRPPAIDHASPEGDAERSDDPAAQVDGEDGIGDGPAPPDRAGTSVDDRPADTPARSADTPAGERPGDPAGGDPDGPRDRTDPGRRS